MQNSWTIINEMAVQEIQNNTKSQFSTSYWHDLVSWEMVIYVLQNLNRWFCKYLIPTTLKQWLHKNKYWWAKLIKKATLFFLRTSRGYFEENTRTIFKLMQPFQVKHGGPLFYYKSGLPIYRLYNSKTKFSALFIMLASLTVCLTKQQNHPR